MPHIQRHIKDFGFPPRVPNHVHMRACRTPDPVVRIPEYDHRGDPNCRGEVAHPRVTPQEEPGLRKESGQFRQTQSFNHVDSKCSCRAGQWADPVVSGPEGQDHGHTQSAAKPYKESVPSGQGPDLGCPSTARVDEDRTGGSIAQLHREPGPGCLQVLYGWRKTGESMFEWSEDAAYLSSKKFRDMDGIVRSWKGLDPADRP